MEVEAKLEEIGLELPEPLKAPSGLVLPFSWVRTGCAVPSLSFRPG